MKLSLLPCLLASLLASSPVLGQATERRPFVPEDVHRLRDVSDIAIAPDGEWVAYTVRTTDRRADKRSTDLHMVSWDGARRLQLTHSDGSESDPRFSPDGKVLAFVTSRGGDGSGEGKDPKTKDQVWLLNRSGGEAERLTEVAGGVSSFEWSPDSTRLILVAKDPKPQDGKDSDTEDEAGGETAQESKKKGRTPKPIVLDRYQFKRDREGYLGDRYERLYLFEIATRTATLLTPGAFDSTEPVWSPHGEQIAFTSKRDGDPDRHRNTDIYVIEAREGATPRQVTTWKGPDSQPAWSPTAPKSPICKAVHRNTPATTRLSWRWFRSTAASP